METVDQLRNELMDAVCLSGKEQVSPFPIFKAKSRGYIKKKNHKCPYSKEFLEDLYLAKGMTRRQIAEQLEVPTRTLDNWFQIRDIRLPLEMYSERVNGQDREAVMSMKRAQVRRQQQLGSKNTHMQYGYVLVYNPGHPYVNNYGYNQEHRHVIESYLHRFLDSDEVVHHIDKNRANNDIRNLALFPNDSDHIKLHRAVELWGFFVCGFSGKPDSVIRFSNKVLWGGEWIEELDLEALVNKKFSKEKEKDLLNMLGNRALQSNPAGGPLLVTATGTTTLGFAPGNTVPQDFIAVSASGAATIALPVVAVTGTALGVGGNQVIRVMNLAAQSLSLAGGGSDTILGSSATIAQNAAATLVSDATNNRWFRY